MKINKGKWKEEENINEENWMKKSWTKIHYLGQLYPFIHNQKHQLKQNSGIKFTIFYDFLPLKHFLNNTTEKLIHIGC